MQVISGVPAGTQRLSRVCPGLSRDGKRRLGWFDFYRAHGQNARLTCRHFGISPQTFYRWQDRYDPQRLESLEDRSHRPKRVRRPEYPSELIEAVLKLRERYPRWGKDKLLVFLKAEGYKTSASTVGRILRSLRQRGILIEPLPNHVGAGKLRRSRPYAVRKPKDYLVKEPGDLIQLDTLDLRPLPGVLLKHFTAHDVISKWNVTSVHRQATAATASHFLDMLEGRMPFPVRAIQVDGGSEFESVFEEECQRRKIRLFVLPPRSPKLNGGVERAHRTHTEEFYEVTDSCFELAELRTLLLEWETVYNHVRPHQALEYLTPYQFLERQRKEVKCH